MLRRLFRKGHADAIGKRTPLKRNFHGNGLTREFTLDNMIIEVNTSI